MAYRRPLLKLLRGLAASQEPSKGAMTIIGEVPDHLLVAPDAVEYITLFGSQAVTFKAIETRFRDELPFEYLKPIEIHAFLWDLVCTVIMNRKLDVAELLDSRLGALARPVLEMQVMFRIENIRLSPGSIAFSDGFVLVPTEEDLIRFGVPKGYWFEHFLNRPSLVVPEDGTDPNLVRMRAMKTAEYRLAALRLVLQQVPLIRSEFLRFRLGTWGAVRRPDGVVLCASVPFARANTFDYGNIREPAEHASELLHRIIGLPARARSSAETAVHWISKSIEESDPDDSVIASFIAIEALLATRKDKMKGERVAYRIALLLSIQSRKFMPPTRILDSYRIRSEVTHGSAYGVATDLNAREARQLATIVLNEWTTYVGDRKLDSVADVCKALIEEGPTELLEASLERRLPNTAPIIEALRMDME